jgi:ankyrin repeat protein
MNLSQAIFSNNITKAKELLENGADPNFSETIVPLSSACYNCSNSEMVQLLLKYGADPTFNKSEVLRIACIFGDTKIVNILLQDRRADPTDDNNYPIKVASLQGHTNVVQLLLRDGRVDPTDENEYAIRFAATQEIKDMLIAYKYRVDGQEYQKLKNNI